MCIYCDLHNGPKADANCNVFFLTFFTSLFESFREFEIKTWISNLQLNLKLSLILKL